MKFQDLNIHSSLLSILEQSGFTILTSVQELVIPHILNKKDLIAIAPTGTGKTEAFTIPILHRYFTQEITLQEQTLILNPTRELALQTQSRINKLIQSYPVTTITLVGGQAYDMQLAGLLQSPTILIATPGRILDLIDQGKITCNTIKTLVIDEFDQLLQLGFIKEVNQILKHLPNKKQSLYFSATLPKDILKIVNKTLKNPIKIEIEKEVKKCTIEESIFYVDRTNKKNLIKYLIELNPEEQILIFSRTTHAVDRIVADLKKEGIVAEGLYADKAQKNRTQLLTAFKSKEIQILVATDLLARGVDIENLPIVINYEVPDSDSLYTHRIGRTGRSMTTGKAYTFCDAQDNNKWIQLQLSLNRQIKINDQHPYILTWEQMISTSQVKTAKKKKK
ncbi:MULTISPECIES: DEAD/DEAH box helicase [unclassified Sphingobacterium]|uniref:DEAD/DEAH box helicase n=1 Tax=unclassified Sphingobacterium TaxID=2609468 RepID=UPI00104A4848|nr:MULTISPECIES: DEAD/DEAH box helicase [unclassified Sphingobacterium]MCS3554363.1 ATP-dependent RNA helicase RhlE [Sphingobacterium sp. JUb21]TCR08196.1 ATP-dependent RNA helicase RhlE [Sphingobacterium sp. JUb20]